MLLQSWENLLKQWNLQGWIINALLLQKLPKDYVEKIDEQDDYNEWINLCTAKQEERGNFSQGADEIKVIIKEAVLEEQEVQNGGAKNDKNISDDAFIHAVNQAFKDDPELRMAALDLEKEKIASEKDSHSDEPDLFEKVFGADPENLSNEHAFSSNCDILSPKSCSLDDEAIQTERQIKIKELFERDRLIIEGLGGVKLSCHQVLEYMKKVPQVKVTMLVSALNMSGPTAGNTLKLLEGKGIIREITGRNYGKIYEYSNYLNLLKEGK
jgi:hypothetical protein